MLSETDNFKKANAPAALTRGRLAALRCVPAEGGKGCEMSVTTTARDGAVVAAVRKDHLEDYNIRLTGGRDLGQLPPPAAPSPERAPAENPRDWPDDYRQVPPYRPVNTGLDREQRPLTGGGVVPNAFVFHMFLGVWVQAVSAARSPAPADSGADHPGAGRWRRGPGGRRAGS